MSRISSISRSPPSAIDFTHNRAVSALLQQALNLERLTLNVFEYNERAVRSYLKAGFVVEGRQRQRLKRGDRRYDMIFMGIEHKADLRRLGDVAARVRRPGGVVWIVFPQGSRVVGTLEISTAARPIGLVAAGTYELSRTHTALRLAPLVVES